MQWTACRFADPRHSTHLPVGDNLRISLNVESLVSLRTSSIDSEAYNLDPCLLSEPEEGDDSGDEEDVTTTNPSHENPIENAADVIMADAAVRDSSPLTKLSESDAEQDTGISPTLPALRHIHDPSDIFEGPLTPLPSDDEDDALRRGDTNQCPLNAITPSGPSTTGTQAEYTYHLSTGKEVGKRHDWAKDAPELAGVVGWAGRPFNGEVGQQIRAQWPTGLGKLLKDAIHIPDQRPTRILDSEGRLVIYRSTIYPWVDMDRFIAAANDFVQRCSPFTEADCTTNVREDHFFCIAGHDRQNKKTPKLSPWHVCNSALIEEFFVKGSPFALATYVFVQVCIVSGFHIASVDREGACSMVQLEFPGIFQRFSNCMRYMVCKYKKRKVHVEARFGIFFNFCLNHSRRGQGIRRVQCWPHVDKANLAIGVCVIFIYGKFDHREFCWLVIWEAGPLIFQLPPGVFLVYPSSLFYHFNIDLRDLDKHIVTTQDGVRPTPDIAESLWAADEDHELNITTMKAGKKAKKNLTFKVNEHLHLFPQPHD
ncbi:hypothetical protein EV421DRAFT_1916392 [Armillaria borealis]|uniref:Uncharacterized protein n=1 Tax=Armillaria borealis TaxID=47425 RepID=A0AA39M5K2_9AGAR|nr:hypothetical protein EV421DRAFT_1916392 [Armillaria borealis]